jgi:hypothetical protein
MVLCFSVYGCMFCYIWFYVFLYMVVCFAIYMFVYFAIYFCMFCYIRFYVLLYMVVCFAIYGCWFCYI